MSTPLVDFAAHARASGAQRRALERTLDDHLRHTGFLLVTGHGVDPSLVRRTREVAARFFALDEQIKAGFPPAVAGAPGYYPLEAGSLARTLDARTPGTRTPHAAPGRPDLKESFTTGPLGGGAGAGGDPALARWFPETRWPDVPGLAATWTAYYRAMDGLATRLLALFARALDLPEDWFSRFCRNPTSTLSAVHYPGTGGDPAALRAGAHSDYGTLTILHKQPGADDLEVLQPGGGWSRLRPARDVFVVNTGDLLAQWTNDRWVSTVHRVVVPDGGSRPSLSLGFFHQPDADALVEAIPSCVSAGHPARYAPVPAGDHLAAKMTRQHTPAPT